MAGHGTGHEVVVAVDQGSSLHVPVCHSSGPGPQDWTHNKRQVARKQGQPVRSQPDQGCGVVMTQPGLSAAPYPSGLPTSQSPHCTGSSDHAQRGRSPGVALGGLAEAVAHSSTTDRVADRQAILLWAVGALQCLSAMEECNAYSATTLALWSLHACRCSEGSRSLKITKLKNSYFKIYLNPGLNMAQSTDGILKILQIRRCPRRCLLIETLVFTAVSTACDEVEVKTVLRT